MVELEFIDYFEFIFLIPIFYSFAYLCKLIRWLIKTRGVKKKYEQRYSELSERNEYSLLFETEAKLYIGVLEYLGQKSIDNLRGFISYASLGVCLYIPTFGMSLEVYWVIILHWIAIFIVGVCMHKYIQRKEKDTKQNCRDALDLHKYHYKEMNKWEQQSIKECIEYCKRDIYD